MNKKEMVEELFERTHLTRQTCTLLLNNFIDIVGDEVSKGGKVSFQGFGTFTLWQQTERPGRNPQTGTPVTIRPRRSVKFRAGTDLLEKVKDKS